jgi:hypothetical protein
MAERLRSSILSVMIVWPAWIGRLAAKGESARPQARHPRPHQARAVPAAKEHFVRDKAARGRLIMPCGTGKSLAAYWIAEALKAKTISRGRPQSCIDTAGRHGLDPRVSGQWPSARLALRL